MNIIKLDVVVLRYTLDLLLTLLMLFSACFHIVFFNSCRPSHILKASAVLFFMQYLVGNIRCEHYPKTLFLLVQSSGHRQMILEMSVMHACMS